jgi:hypothetical protein
MRQFLGFKQAVGYFLIAALLVTAHAPWPELVKGSLADPDSYMRMVWLNDMLERSDALHKVVRDGSGEGTTIHWSHLLTSMIYALAVPLALFMPMKTALHAVALLFGPLTVGALGVLAAWAPAPITSSRWRWLAPVAVAVSAPVVTYGGPGVADHHILLAFVALALAGCAGRVVAGGRNAASALGAMSAIGLWLSPEALPFIVMALGACLLPWIFAQGDERRRAGALLALASGVFVVGVGVTLLIDPPAGGYAATDNDRLSIVYLALSACLFASFSVLNVLTGSYDRPATRAALSFGVILVPLIGWAFVFPSLLQGFMPFSVNQDIRSFFDDIEEMAPVTSVGEVLCFLTDVVLATLALLWFAFRFRSVYWLYAAACVVVTIAMGVLHRRFLIYTGVVSAAMLPVLLDECTRLLGGYSREMQAIGRLSLVFLTLMPNRVYAAFGGGNESVASGSAEPSAIARPTCNVRDFSPFLRSYPGEVVMADVNYTPALLYHSPIVTVGSMYHRGFAASKRLTDAWLSGPSATVPDEIKATKARYLLICKTGGSFPRIPDAALFARLQRGETPAWLSEVTSEPKTGFILYRIQEEGAPARPE